MIVPTKESTSVKILRPIHLLLLFAYHEAMSCLFPVLIFLTLSISKKVTIPFLHRYDFILLVCILIQVIMVKTGLETKDELKVIMVFHGIGLLLELYKVHMGSWAYPEDAWTKFAGVPLYSGFMYASVASYLIQAWRRLQVQLHHWPSQLVTITMGLLIYFNFFTHHFIPDLRWILVALLFILFFRSYVAFTVGDQRFRMPIILSFLLIGFFVWVAENIATFYGAWQYPNQHDHWQMVHLEKISSWGLLVIVSFIIVAQLKHVKEQLQQKKEADRKVQLSA